MLRQTPSFRSLLVRQNGPSERQRERERIGERTRKGRIAGEMDGERR